MKINTLTRGNRVGRDRRPKARGTYITWAAFWAAVTGAYTWDLATGRDVGPAWISWFFLVVSVVYLAGNLRIVLQYKGRQVEWATHVHEHNAAMRARYAPDANPGMFDKEV